MDGCGFLHWRFFDYDFRLVRIFIYLGIYEVVKRIVESEESKMQASNEGCA